MANKKPNFLQNVWNKGKEVILKGVTLGGNAAGSLIGIPVAGTAIANILDKIPTMAEKAAQQGVVKTEKVAETLVANGIAPTQANISLAADVVKQEAQKLVNDPSVATAPKVTQDNKALNTTTVVMNWVKKNWYVPAGVALVFVYLIATGQFTKSKNKKRRF
jgi:hypothetical protein